MPAGIRCKLYVRTAGNFASPTFTVVPIVGDISETATWNYAEAPTRETPVIRGSRTTFSLSVTGKMRLDLNGTNYLLFDNAAHNSSSNIDVMVLNGDQNTNTVTGFRYEAEVVNWSEDQSLTNEVMKDFELRPTLSGNLPKRVVVASGAPVFSDLV